MKFDNFDNKSFDRYLGVKLRDYRRRQKLTLVDTARLVGISYQQLQKYESSLSRISAVLLYKLSLVYMVSIDTIFNNYTRKIFENYSNSVNLEKKPVNILIIEDNPDDEKIIQRALDGIPNLNVMFVHDCRQAMRLLRQQSDFEEFRTPDLIFLDYYMPKRDGLSMLRDLKSDRRFSYVPTIMLTNNVNAKSMISAYQLGASGYICKSFEFAKFKDNIVSSINYWTKTIIPPSRIGTSFHDNEGEDVSTTVL